MSAYENYVPRTGDRSRRAREKYAAWMASGPIPQPPVPHPQHYADGNTARLFRRGYKITPQGWRIAHASTGSTLGEYELERARVPMIETIVPMVASRPTQPRPAVIDVASPFTQNAAAPLVGPGGAKIAHVRPRASGRLTRPVADRHHAATADVHAVPPMAVAADAPRVCGGCSKGVRRERG
jgi:hypothetical protein